MIHYDAKLEDFISPDAFVETRGLGLKGHVQKIIDAAVTRACNPYVPFDEGVLAGSANTETEIGMGEVIYDTPYARYLYYGEVYGPNIPIEENGEIVGYWSPPKKHPTGAKLEYNTEKHPQAGSHWFDRAMADHKDEILKEAQDAADSVGDP